MFLLILGLTVLFEISYGDTVLIQKKEFDKLMAKVEKLEEFTKVQMEKTEKLEQMVAKIEELELFVNTQLEINRKQETELENLKELVKQQVLHIQQQEKVLEDVNRRNEASNQIQARSAKDIRVKAIHPRQAANNLVAFFASTANLNQDHLGIHQNLIFDDVKTNIGGGFNRHHGVFMAPVSGLYLITTTLLTGPNREIWAAIVVNGTDIAHLNERGTDGRHGSTSHTVIVRLQKGDSVSVQNYVQTDDSYWGDKFSSFSGFLIAEMDNDETVIVG